MKIVNKSFDKRTKLNCGIVIYVIKQLILKVDQNISSLILINTKKRKVLLEKNMKLLDQTLAG